MPTQRTLAEFKDSKAGQTIARLLREPEALATMETLSRAGRPAVLALDAALPADIFLDNSEKQHAGRMVREHLRGRGWHVGPRRQFAGRVFSSGAVYEHSSSSLVAPHAAAADGGFRARIAEAQDIVRRGSVNNYGVGDFLRDRRAEAVRERRG